MSEADRIEPAGPAGPAQTSGKAVAALVISLVGFTSCGLLGIVGIILGNQALDEIAYANGQLHGEGLARAGVIVGWIQLALIAVAVLFGCLIMGLVAVAGA